MRNMNTLVCALAYWRSAEQVAAIAPALRRWRAMVSWRFQTGRLFLASGTQSDPELNPIREDAPLVSARVPYTKPYSVYGWCYGLCAIQAALTFADDAEPWDVFAMVDTDLVITDHFDWPALSAEFMARSETVMSPAWAGGPCMGSFIFLKPPAVTKWLNGRLRPNLCAEEPKPMLCEPEAAAIFGPDWWNPWPQFKTIRQEWGMEGFTPVHDEDARMWPAICRPSPAMRALFESQPL